ncbi:hypothetical protein [Legionella cardiaca]|uniref:Uncharacterized protein n=1 Tax=Legionella cardiaca TaxID=1071983 RepID=A0ABY8AU81_9GAMM|nr:hypothetical protein [Legionella cardiaca]WED42697.1 hypothetical protein PXX05_12440 [Legionella cardiaca]
MKTYQNPQPHAVERINKTFNKPGEHQTSKTNKKSAKLTNKEIYKNEAEEKAWEHVLKRK